MIKRLWVNFIHPARSRHSSGKELSFIRQRAVIYLAKSRYSSGKEPSFIRQKTVIYLVKSRHSSGKKLSFICHLGYSNNNLSRLNRERVSVSLLLVLETHMVVIVISFIIKDINISQSDWFLEPFIISF